MSEETETDQQITGADIRKEGVEAVVPDSALSKRLSDVVGHTQSDEDLEELQKQVAELERIKGMSPVDYLRAQGHSKADIVKMVQAQEEDPFAAQQKRLDELEKKLAERDEMYSQKEQEQRLEQVRADVINFVDASEDYPAIKAVKSQDLVFQRMYQTYVTTGQEISEKQAASEIETELRNVFDALKGIFSQEDSKSHAKEPTTLTSALSKSLNTPEFDKLPKSERLELILRGGA